jgi:hypothetical protein
MKKVLGLLAAVSALVLASAGMAGANGSLTDQQQVREGKCLALAADSDVTATFQLGDTWADDRCSVVSTEETLVETIEQVNNDRAKKAVIRVTITTQSVTTTQLYRYQLGGNSTANFNAQNNNGSWVEHGAPLTSDEDETITKCMRNPGGEHCEEAA